MATGREFAASPLTLPPPPEEERKEMRPAEGERNGHERKRPPSLAAFP
jgi:hypothetical protein